MCGRYVITTPPHALEALFGLVGPAINMPARYNIAPTQPVPIVREGPKGRSLDLVRWGLVPGWAKEIGTKPLINARAETVREKPSFSAPFKRRRCLLPADGFYEWLRREGDPRNGQAYYVSPTDGDSFAMAAIWEHWHGPDGSELETAAVLTCAANGPLAEIHHRMPCVVAPEYWDRWLDPGIEAGADLHALLGPAREDFFTVRAVSNAVNKVVNDGPELLDRVEAPSALTKPDPAPQLSLF